MTKQETEMENQANMNEESTHLNYKSTKLLWISIPILAILTIGLLSSSSHSSPKLRFLAPLVSKSWRDLLDALKKDGTIKTEKVYNAMLKTDRIDFVEEKEFAYYNGPEYLGYHASLSAPHIHAFELETLAPYIKEGSKILDIGSGSGYLEVAFSKLMNEKGLVVGVEHIYELYKLGRKNIEKNNKHLLESKKIILANQDGRKGFKDYAPYDVILVGGVAMYPEDELLDQLANGGTLYIPIYSQTQNVTLFHKDENGKITKKVLGQQIYPPLTSTKNQLAGLQ